MCSAFGRNLSWLVTSAAAMHSAMSVCVLFVPHVLDWLLCSSSLWFALAG